MSEYIVDIPESYPFKIVQDGWHYHVECEYQQREEIVRCRDCREYNTELYRHISCELLGRYVKPNDFCSLGVKK